MRIHTNNHVDSYLQFMMITMQIHEARKGQAEFLIVQSLFQLCLHSMHKYQPVIHIEKTDPSGLTPNNTYWWQTEPPIFRWPPEEKFYIFPDSFHHSDSLPEPAGLWVSPKYSNLKKKIAYCTTHVTFSWFKFSHFMPKKSIEKGMPAGSLTLPWHPNPIPQITKLKIASNPFAKGFREATRGSSLVRHHQVDLIRPTQIKIHIHILVQRPGAPFPGTMLLLPPAYHHSLLGKLEEMWS